ncbi:hypothetical protein PABY_00880 [Pyrodictium abyssi]|uniref:Uncharacterized protein n=1 Tax=Pyrodictium abyssi TaxID=54256 RepID=A0ABM8IWV4_9CREN|nr:hypothetical protein PABY_00880 [Pyrodictium abyssi]
MKRTRYSSIVHYSREEKADTGVGGPQQKLARSPGERPEPSYTELAPGSRITDSHRVVGSVPRDSGLDNPVRGRAMPQMKACLVCHVPFYAAFALFVYIGASHALEGQAQLAAFYLASLFATLGSGYACCRRFGADRLPPAASVLRAVWPAIAAPIIPIGAAMLCSKQLGPEPALCRLRPKLVLLRRAASIR